MVLKFLFDMFSNGDFLRTKIHVHYIEIYYPSLYVDGEKDANLGTKSQLLKHFEIFTMEYGTAVVSFASGKSQKEPIVTQ